MVLLILIELLGIGDLKRREMVNFNVFRIGNGGRGRERRTVYVVLEIMTNTKSFELTNPNNIVGGESFKEVVMFWPGKERNKMTP